MQMMKIENIVAFLAILGVALPVNTANATPLYFKNYTAYYAVRYDGIPIGHTVTILKINSQNHYNLCIKTKTNLPFLHGTVTECSRGLLNPVMPLQYDYDYTLNKTHKNIRIDFDWKTKQAIIHTHPTWRMAIPTGTQDKVSYQLLLRQGLADNKKTFSFPVADGGKLKTYQFTITKVIQDNINHNTIIQINSQQRRHIILWVNKNKDYFITKVQHTGTAELISCT